MALLTAHDLRLTQHGREVLASVGFTLAGSRAVVVGAPAVLFDALVGVVAPSAGTLDRHGHSPIDAGRMPAYPPRWTVLEWLGWRLRLVGVPAAAGRDALGAFGLAAHGVTLVSKTPLLVRRALPLIAAIAAAPQIREPLLVLDDAFTGLDDPEAHELAATFVSATATASCAWIALLPVLPLRSPLALAADDVLVLDAGEIVAQGSALEVLAGERGYVVRVLGSAIAWPEKLEELGIRLVSQRDFVRDGDTGRELTVAFEGERGPRDLFALSADSGDVILELFPASGKLV